MDITNLLKTRLLHRCHELELRLEATGLGEGWLALSYDGWSTHVSLDTVPAEGLHWQTNLCDLKSAGKVVVRDILACLGIPKMSC